MNISLYIHIPFCTKKKCLYCDFYSVPYNTSLADAFIAALGKDWLLVKKDLGLEDSIVETIFFGGGTPSTLSPMQWDRVNACLIRHLNLAKDCEWTVECNPDSFTDENARLWQSFGVTRLTLGVQSLRNNELRFLGRPHTAEQALSVIESSAVSGFKSIGIDLMYGCPHQTVKSFEESLHAALLTPVVRHMSAYELTLCKSTPFGKVKDLPLPDEDTVYEMARALFTRSKEAGFERYEISNFARPGHRCRHNEAYWNHSPYIGLGPAAHSYLHPHRWANAGDVNRYISLLESGMRPVDFEETIDHKKLASEMIFLRLRTGDGLNEETFAHAASEAFYSSKRRNILDHLMQQGIMHYHKPFWTLSESGMMVADGIARKLI
jgi:oxygen-independent coproporphyrinogen-3 oxidase